MIIKRRQDRHEIGPTCTYCDWMGLEDSDLEEDTLVQMKMITDARKSDLS